MKIPDFLKGKYERRIDFYRQRKEDYIAALPKSYPYIYGWDGVDRGDVAIVKTGPRTYTTMSMDEALSRGLVQHPYVFDPRFSTKYAGDFYMSPNQMWKDFR